MGAGAEDSVVYELTAPGGGETYFHLTVDGGHVNRHATPGPLLDWIIADISRRALTGLQGALAVHAGVVSLNGAAVMLPAPPDHGKSTTVAALVRDGFDFLSDEACIIRPDSRTVDAFARPLFISPDSMRALPGLRDSLSAELEAFRHLDHHVSPEDLRPGCVASTARLACIVAPRYDPSAATSLLRMSRADALTLLLRQCFNPAMDRSTTMRLLADVVRSVPCYRLSVSDIDAAVAEVRGVMDGISVPDLAFSS